MENHRKKNVLQIAQQEKNRIAKLREEIREEEQEISLKILIYCMVNVLSGAGYWEKSYKKKIPKLLEDMADLSLAIGDGTVSMEEVEELTDIASGHINISDEIMGRIAQRKRKE